MENSKINWTDHTWNRWIGAAMFGGMDIAMRTRW